GGNDYHGTGYYFLRDAALNANDWFSNRAGRPLPALHPVELVDASIRGLAPDAVLASARR
ncbi:MAG: hypothetical protein C4307_04095, partial [Chloroflexota bacterium]